MSAHVMPNETEDVSVCAPGTETYLDWYNRGGTDENGYPVSDPGHGACVPDDWHGAPIDVGTQTKVRVGADPTTGAVRGVDPWGRPFDSSAATSALGHYAD